MDRLQLYRRVMRSMGLKLLHLLTHTTPRRQAGEMVDSNLSSAQL